MNQNSKTHREPQNLPYAQGDGQVSGLRITHALPLGLARGEEAFASRRHARPIGGN